MDKILIIILPLLLIVGCFKRKEPIHYEQMLIERYGVFYTKDTNKPYSGPVFSIYSNSKKRNKGVFKDGKRDRLWTTWYENGKKSAEGFFKNGELDGKWTHWYKNGQKLLEGTLQDGKQNGKFISWYENGQKNSEYNVSHPESGGKLEGRRIHWYKNGQKEYEGTYKDGILLDEKFWSQDGSEINLYR